MAKERRTVLDVLRSRNRTAADAGYDEEKERLREQSAAKNKAPSRTADTEVSEAPRKGATATPHQVTAKKASAKSPVAAEVKKEALEVPFEKPGSHQSEETPKPKKIENNKDLPKSNQKLSEAIEAVNEKIPELNVKEDVLTSNVNGEESDVYFQPAAEFEDLDLTGFLSESFERSSNEARITTEQRSADEIIPGPKSQQSEQGASLKRPTSSLEHTPAVPISTGPDEDKPFLNNEPKPVREKPLKAVSAVKVTGETNHLVGLTTVHPAVAFDSVLTIDAAFVGALLLDPNMKLTSIRLLLVLCHAVKGEFGKFCEFRHKDFAYRAGGVNETNTKRDLKALEEMGCITRVKARANAAYLYALNGDYFKKFSTEIFVDPQ